jgi:hypothetical protein
MKCKLACSNARNLEKGIDCELACWKGKQTHLRAAISIFCRGAARARRKRHSVFFETQAPAILGALFASTTYTACLRPAAETAWYSMLMAPSEHSTLPCLGQKRPSPGFSSLARSGVERAGRLSVQIHWKEVRLATRKPRMKSRRASQAEKIGEPVQACKQHAIRKNPKCCWGFL